MTTTLPAHYRGTADASSTPEPDPGSAPVNRAGPSAELTAATSQVKDETDAMAAGVEQLIGLMTGVADGADLIRTSTLAVVDSAHAATGSVDQLKDASTRITEFTKLITAIAEQTKLLALNATIEATRAGAAGAAFSVVAREVKELATRAKNATDQVADIIVAIESGSESVSKALETIVGGIDTVGEQQLSVNKIVDQQVEKVDEISNMATGLVGSVDRLSGVVNT